MACGVYGANYLLEALYNEGEGDYALKLLTSDSDRSWVNMIRMGATMTTEAWDFKYKGNIGWSHAWSASPAHIIPRKLIGIKPVEPGFKKIRIKPQLGDLTAASLKLPTIRGNVFVDIEVQEGQLFLKAKIPANTSASIFLPTTTRDENKLSYKSIGEGISGNGILFKSFQDDYALFEIEAGEFELAAPYNIN
jgi:alpha-L-rhamnosidase